MAQNNWTNGASPNGNSPTLSLKEKVALELQDPEYLHVMHQEAQQQAQA